LLIEGRQWLGTIIQEKTYPEGEKMPLGASLTPIGTGG